jgi:single-stranded-DNA-specific exonuclease RecJ
MEIIYGKTPSIDEYKSIMQIASSLGISTDTARLLYCRNINTVEKAKAFLNPGKKGFLDPFMLSGMRLAVERITQARTENQSVLIFGDYDADGVCATTVLYNALNMFGITARTVIPERVDGYGLNLDIITTLHTEKPIDLIITVDCGISDAETINLLKEKGIDVIVTDHHEPPETLPDCIRINPKIKDQAYPFDSLAGAGVAYKLGKALIGDKADLLLDYVALATVADSMDLIGENRDIVAEGLKLLNGKHVRPEFKYLIGDVKKPVTAQTLAYAVAPRINAGGRMGDAKTSLKLFLSNTESEKYDYAVKLNEYNISRQIECDNIYKSAKEKIKQDGGFLDEVILVGDDTWQTGFVGIVASRLVEEFSRPVIVFAGYGEYLKGSARSVDGINIFQAINACKDLLVGFGGHAQAAGVTVEKTQFENLKKALNTYVKTNYGKLDVAKKISVEWEVDKPFSLNFAREIELLEPFGVGNKKPLFATEVGAVKAMPLKFGSPHYSFKTNALEILDFNAENEVEVLSLEIPKKVVFEINLSTYNNNEYLKGYLKAVVPNYQDLTSLKYSVFQNELKKSLDGRLYSVEQTTDVSILSGDGYGTLYLASNVTTLSKYPELSNLPISIYTLASKNFSDAVVVSATEIPEGYGRVVYLDKPLSYLKTNAKIYRFTGRETDCYLDSLSVDREDFKEVYTALLTLVDKEYRSSAWAFNRYQPMENGYMFVFGAEVFLELGIFFVKDGILRCDCKIKNALTNSKLYSKICIAKV